MQPLALTLSLALLVAAPACAQTMQVSPNGSRPSVAGAPANFTGAVVVKPLFAPNAQTNAGGGQVALAPGARWPCHTHPAGQTLIVTSGTGWVQQEGGEKIAIKPG